MKTPKTFSFDTLSLHAGARPDPSTGARATPIYQTAAFAFRDTDHAASIFNIERAGRGSKKDPPVDAPPTLAEQGVDKKTANLARKLAALSDTERNAVAARDKTLAAVTREKTAKARETRLNLPDATYSESGKAGAAGDVVLVGASCVRRLTRQLS